MALIQDSLAQSWGESQNCHINARTSDTRFAGRTDVIDATFRWRVTRQDGTSVRCTGVLMNRRVDQDELGFYFSTARHCLHYQDVDFGLSDIDLNVDHFFMFHYESPSGVNIHTKPSNQGQQLHQSNTLDPVLPAQRGYEYMHKSKVELVKESIMADYALLRIVTPPPPHFNLYFSGWQPNNWLLPHNVPVPFPCGLWHQYVMPNHPKGDIKKINGAALVLNPTLPTYTLCNMVTSFIDIAFGWIWNNTNSTQGICAYTDIPWYQISWCDHNTEKGSSGAPLFNANDRYIGPLTGGPGVCTGAFPNYVGKFKNVYPFSAIKNALNPSHHLGTDLTGMDGRRITCYTNLELPGGGLDEAYYFPANHYQADNRITLRAQQGINVVEPITILEGAHYEFLAGESVELNGFVDVRPGATFVAAIEGCTKSMEINSSGTFSPSFVRLPEKLILDGQAVVEEPDIPSQEKYMTVFPNPAYNVVQFRTDLAGPWDMRIIGPTGTAVRSQWLRDGTVNVSGLAPGIYHLRISDADGDQRTARLVISD